MKKTIKPFQAEESKFFCDRHKKRECYAEVKLSGWYGSYFDCQEMVIHLCDECVREVSEYLVKNFNGKAKDIF